MDREKKRELLARGEAAAKKISARSAMRDFETVSRMPDSEWAGMTGAEKSDALYNLIAGATLLTAGAKSSDTAMVLAREAMGRDDLPEDMHKPLAECLRMGGV